jgi:uncharacterized protein (TIGR02421 family)
MTKTPITQASNLPPTLTQEVIDLDFQLHELVRKIDIINAVKPLNYQEQKRVFFTNQFSIEPVFKYQKHSIDPFHHKRMLYNLPIDDIHDRDLYHLYLAIIDSYTDKIDQLKSVGTNEFLYDSLRYYGEPSEKDIRNAQFILHLPNRSDEDEGKLLNAEEIKTVLAELAHHEKYSWHPIFDETLIANALASGTNVKINPNAKMTEMDTRALAHHELGVHLATTLNGHKQPLHILSLGCPINTTTQEGLAILSEYLSGNMTINRLKILALRVLAVNSMIHEKNFRSTFLLLKEEYQVEDELAFTITARVYRGGGFTKDYLYLSGFSQMLNAFENEPNFHNLLAGKASLEYLPTITKLINKGILVAPHFISPAFRSPVANDAVNTFITHAIR